MKVIKDNVKTPIFSWCPDIEEGALDQMKTIANLPFVSWCAIMPDSHLGMACPIGGVVACKDVVVPTFVGSDISCGVLAIKTSLNLTDLTEDKKIEIYNSVKRSIPFGFAHNNTKQVKELTEKYMDYFSTLRIETKIDKFNYNPLNNKEINAPTSAFFEQLGTLGGG